MNAARPPGDAELVARLRLARTETVGPRSYRALVDRFGNARAALEALPHMARRGGRRDLRIPDAETALREIEALARLGGRFVALGEDDYPPPLAAIHDAPPLLALIGRTDLLQGPAIAVVGSRNASAAGRRFTETLARELGAAGHVIVSGLARGIDAAAHRGALASGTVAVLAGGVDHVYPPENRGLYDDIAATGTLLSDQPMGLVPHAGHFPRRNRIVAGLTRATVVVEATATSGALITARLAAEEGRDVFAVPGSPMEPRSKGANRLIRDGASLVESAEDVLEALVLPTRSIPRVSTDAVEFSALPEAPEPAEIEASEAHARLLAALGGAPVEVDELVRRCQLTASEAQILLLDLELAGRVERHPGNKVSLVSS